MLLLLLLHAAGTAMDMHWPSVHSYIHQVALARIQSLKTEILVQTPGKLGSAHPMPQLMMPPRNQRPSFPLTTSGPPESP